MLSFSLLFVFAHAAVCSYPDGPLPNHGFARTSVWTCASNSDAGEAVFTLTDSAETRALWQHAFALEYVVRVTPTSLVTLLRVSNTGAAPFTFQALQHTYYAHQGVDGVRVAGLKGASYLDKVAEGKSVEEVDDAVVVTAETDRIYKDVRGPVELSGVGAAGVRTADGILVRALAAADTLAVVAVAGVVGVVGGVVSSRR